MAANDYSPWFWDVIAKAQENDNDFKTLVQEMSRDEVIQFYQEFVEAAADLCTTRHLDYLADASEDTVQDITEYVVSKGRNYYKEVCDHPAKIPTEVKMDAPSFKGVALLVYWEKYGESIPR